MTDFEYRKSIDDVIYLCSCAVNGTAPEKERVDSLDLDSIYEFSQKHMLASMVGTVLKGAGISSNSFSNRLRKNGDGKLRYIKRRVFGPDKDDQDRKQFERRYATFFKYPILLPLLPFYRLFKALKTSPKRIKAEANALRKVGKATR